MCTQVVHGDIKLDNIVITKDLKHVAICDFGTAGLLPVLCSDEFFLFPRIASCRNILIESDFH